MKLNINIDENFILSAKPPTISAGVIIAKVNWNITNTVSGISPDIELADNPAKNELSKPPM